jgi:hypothetical protein
MKMGWVPSTVVEKGAGGTSVFSVILQRKLGIALLSLSSEWVVTENWLGMRIK